MKFRVLRGFSVASGSICGFRLLKKLRQRPKVEIHLVLSRAGEKTGYLESGNLASGWKDLDHHGYPNEDIGSALARGSFQTRGMFVACSLKMVREKPLHVGHLRTRVALAKMGAIIVAPVHGFSQEPQTVIDLERVVGLLRLPSVGA